ERLQSDALGVPGGVPTRVGRPKREGAADFWNALGGQYRVSLDYVATLPCDPGVTFHRGPPVRSQRVLTQDRHERRALTTELHRTSGTVRGPDAAPVAGAWLALPDVGTFATSGDDGRFVLERVPAGEHRCECRAPDGRKAAAVVVVPGPGVDIELPGA